jgi:hypothetical protein
LLQARHAPIDRSKDKALLGSFGAAIVSVRMANKSLHRDAE